MLSIYGKLYFTEIKKASLKEAFVRVIGLEPTHREAPDPKSGVSTNFTTPAGITNLICVSLLWVQIYA